MKQKSIFLSIPRTTVTNDYDTGLITHSLAKNMQLKREYIVQDNAIYPVDYRSTGVIETNKKWGDGLQQFLELKHGLPCSPLSLITNFLSNIDFFNRFGSNILGVSGTLGNDPEKQFMRDTFSVELATIPTSKTRKIFELDGLILKNKNNWLEDVAKISWIRLLRINVQFL